MVYFSFQILCLKSWIQQRFSTPDFVINANFENYWHIKTMPVKILTVPIQQNNTIFRPYSYSPTCVNLIIPHYNETLYTLTPVPHKKFTKHRSWDPYPSSLPSMVYSFQANKMLTDSNTSHMRRINSLIFTCQVRKCQTITIGTAVSGFTILYLYSVTGHLRKTNRIITFR